MTRAWTFYTHHPITANLLIALFFAAVKMAFLPEMI
jgi:hypothetical protein